MFWRYEHTTLHPDNLIKNMDAFDLAMKNTLQFGDTDIFPIPYEYDFLWEKSRKIKDCINSCSSIFIEAACSLHAEVRKSRGGYRTATLIDPLLHLKYLALAIEIAGITEKNRVRKEDHIVHSYRFCPDETTGKLFDTQYGFSSFKSACRDKEKAGYTHKIEMDVLDFYHSVDLSIMETILAQHGIDETVAVRIIAIINQVNNGGNGGLPVGGNASRILAEILLNELDQYCLNEGIDYVRFVDDVVVFSKGDEVKDLFAIHQKLSSLGLTLNYSKLQISECFEHSDYFEEICTYNDLCNFPDEIIFEKEIEKIKQYKGIHPGFLERINHPVKVNIFLWMLADVLGYVHTGFGAVCKWILKHQDVLDDMVIEKIGNAIAKQPASIHGADKLSHAARILGLWKSNQAVETLIRVYEESGNSFVRSNVIHVFGVWGHAGWFWENYGSTFRDMDLWERRAIIMAPGTAKIWAGEKLSPLEQLLIDKHSQ